MTAADITYTANVGRWAPDSRGRLAQAAFALYSERGFDNTTVAEIAERAGVTERTFFRHFADKREVLFAGSSALQDAMVAAVGDAPADATPLEAVAAGLDAAGEFISDRKFSAQRQAIIGSNPELQERELIKLATLSSALAETLRSRGVSEPAATLTADIAMSVFRIGFTRWLEGSDRRDLAQTMRASLSELKTVAV
jgi:AcrR family transcriptional regulator